MNSKREENLADGSIEEFWQRIGKNYSKNSANYIVFKGLLMASFLDLQNAQNVVEVGCGDGRISVELALRKRVDAQLTLVDLAGIMCNLTATKVRKLAQLIEQPFGMLNFEEKLEELEASEIDFIEPVIIPELNVSIHKGSNENLESIVNSNSTDIYIASLSLHIVTNPERMIAEAYRVLRTGGKAIMSVWGAKEGSTRFTIVSDVIAREGITTLESRSNFHLNNKDSTINLFEKAGFKNVIGWTEFVPQKRIEEDLLKQQITESMRHGLMATPEHLHRLEELSKVAIDEFLKLLNEEKIPIGFNTLIISAEK